MLYYKKNTKSIYLTGHITFRSPGRNNTSGKVQPKAVTKTFMKTFKKTNKNPVSFSHIPISWLFKKVQVAVFEGVRT